MILHSILLLSVSLQTDCGPIPKLGSEVATFSTNLRTMFQDRGGKFWFGSYDEGVSRYDSKSIVRFTTKDGLSGNQVGGIQQDKKGYLYFTTNGGISKYDGKTLTTLKPVVMNSSDKGWRLRPDDLWFTWGKGAPSRYDGKTLYSLRFPKHPMESKRHAQEPRFDMYALYTIYKDRTGYLWFGTGDAGLCRYDGKTINWLYRTHRQADRSASDRSSKTATESFGSATRVAASPSLRPTGLRTAGSSTGRKSGRAA